MAGDLNRRAFLQMTSGCTLALCAGPAFAFQGGPRPLTLVSPGCVKSRLRVAKIYAGVPGALADSSDGVGRRNAEV